ncbi:hypothetical protein RMCBS344292_14357 [Rhizopus microsporus]|nr:hypothetical protein RMCBS344292_14357 [Rhizopus microsporus]
MTIMTAPSELDQRELIDFEDNDDNVLVMQDGNVIRNGRILSAEPTASPLSSITFSWMNPLLKAAFHSRLTVTSLWELPARQRARENYRLFAEQQRASTVITVSSLLQRIFKANRAIIIHQFVTAIGAVIFHYANPYFLRQLLNYIQVHQKEDRVDREIGYLYCLALFICSVISTLIASQSLLWGRRWHVNIVHMLNSEIYAHALRLKQAHDMSEDEEEEKSNLINQDTERVAELASYLHIFYTCPLEIIAGVVFLYQILGTAFLAGLIVMVIALPSTHYINQKLMKAQTHLNDAKSWRIRLLKELCEGMKTIKTLASERRWEDAISSARDEELVKLIKVYTQNTLLNLIWFAMPVFVTTTSFAWYTLVEKKSLDASTAFVSIVLFGMLRDPLNVVPQAFIAYNDIYVSLGHVVRFLNTEEKRDDAEIVATCDSDNEDGDHPFDYEEQSKITLRTAVFKWSSGNDAFRLKVPFELEIPSSRLSVLSGPSACGKTSLLKAMLGDMPLDSGERPLLPSRFLCTANTHKSLVRDPVCPLLYLHKVAYVSQTAWIEHTTVRENILFSESWDDARYRTVLHQCDLLRDLSLTVRENILFSESWDDARYRTVLHQCDLLRDLSLFENGDLTVVGDKSTIFNNGVNIEALYHKISLARAVYSRAKTVLIDDIFQVLGKTVSTFIYENCIRGDLMRERTVIVAAAYPDMFWARDAAIFIHISLVSNGQGVVDSVETDPEKIVGMIKQRRADRLTLVDAVRHYDIFGDVVDVLFENNSVMAGVFTEDEFFDEASIMPASIRLLDEEENAKRDYAYATYLSACGGWQYWSFAVLFTLLACISNIAESYWLKEGLVHDLSNTYLLLCHQLLRTRLLGH